MVLFVYLNIWNEIDRKWNFCSLGNEIFLHRELYSDTKELVTFLLRISQNTMAETCR